MADHFSKSENFPFASTSVSHFLFFTLPAVVSCFWNKAGCVSTTFGRGMIHFWPHHRAHGGVSGAAPSPWGFTLLIQMPTLCKPRATLTAPACHAFGITWPQLQQPCHNSLAPLWPCVSFYGSQKPWECYGSKNGHVFVKQRIIIRLPHNLRFLHFISNDIQNMLCMQKEKGQEGWKEEAQGSVGGQTLAEMCWRASQAGRVRTVLSILSIVMDSRTVWLLNYSWISVLTGEKLLILEEDDILEMMQPVSNGDSYNSRTLRGNKEHPGSPESIQMILLFCQIMICELPACCSELISWALSDWHMAICTMVHLYMHSDCNLYYPLKSDCILVTFCDST